MTTKRVRYTFACGHIRHYWTTVGRNMRFSGPCGPCRTRQERAIPAFLDHAHELFANMGRCIRDSARLTGRGEA